jgi:NAD(P)H-hydrate epimerase
MTAPANAPIPNSPDLWRHRFPWPAPDGHKYDRGHTVIFGGDWLHTGATKLAAHAALRVGSGLVSVACDARALPIYAASFQAVMTKLVETSTDMSQLAHDLHVTAVLIGPGAGVTDRTKTRVIQLLACRKPMVLDADALTTFAALPKQLLDATHTSCILTPHAGEFVRLFGGSVAALDTHEVRLSAALHASRISGAVVVLKGAATVIATPDGKAAITSNAPAFLATAGSGDVLAGLCAGLLAQSMPVFETACAAVWLHGAAANQFGAGLIAEDIADQLPNILTTMHDGP